jgi:predicted nucleic acid-binding protein
MNRLFVDTGAWFAYFNEQDPDHLAVGGVLDEWAGRLVTTDYVFDELVTLVRYRVGHPDACAAGGVLRDPAVVLLVTVGPADVEAAWVRFRRDADKAYSFTDSTSFAVMERLQLTTAAAVDADFRRAGFGTLPEWTGQRP